MNTTTAERPQAATLKTKAEAIRAARAALGDDAIEGLDFQVKNTGAGWTFAEIGDALVAPPIADNPAVVIDPKDPEKRPDAPPPAKQKAKAPKKAKANVEAPVKPKTKTGGAGSKPPRKPPAPPATAPKAAAPKKERKPRAGKTATLIGLLRRPEGATMPELIAASSWAENSLKWFMKGTLGKKDLTVTSTTAGDPPVTTYRINEEAI